MGENLYIKEDGSVKDDIVAQQAQALASSAERHGYSKEYVDSLMAEVQENGYVIIENLVPRETMMQMKEEVLPLLQYDGRTEFEGYKTRRIYAVIEKTLALNPLVDHPLIMALLDQLFQPNYLLSQLQAINVLPGEIAQPLHADDGFYPIPRPRPPIGAACIWAIDDFTEANGATRIIPGSHKWGDEHPGDGSGYNLVPAEMPSGSCLFFLGTAWHGAGANVTDKARFAATTQYCEPWARQQENYSLAISRERAKLCSEKIQKMLGYSMQFPFIGFVNGRDPIRLLQD